MTTPYDQGLNARVRAAILDRVAAGESIPAATEAVGLGAIDEARQEGFGLPEFTFIAWHVVRLGADLMAGIGRPVTV